MKAFCDLEAIQQDLITRLNNLEFDAAGNPNAIVLNQIRIEFEESCILEEETMRKVDYPYLHAHLLAHAITSKYFLRLSPAHQYTVSNLITDVMLHINTYDQQFIDYITNNNK